MADARSPDSALCGPSIYPCGPYGQRLGDVIADLRFSGYTDRKHLCKPLGKLAIDVANTAVVSLSQWYAGANTCSGTKRELLWVFITAGW